MNDGTNASSLLLCVNDGADGDKNAMITSHPMKFYCIVDKDKSDTCMYDYADRNDASAFNKFVFHLLPRCIAITVEYTCHVFSNA